MINRRDASLFHALCTKDGWQQYAPKVVQVAWPKTDLKLLYGYMQRLHETTDGDYTPQDIAAYVESVCRDERLGGLQLVLREMQDTKPMAPKLLRAAVNEFVARQHVHKAAQYAAQHHDKDDFELGKIVDMVRAAEEVYEGVADERGQDYASAPLPNEDIDRPGKCPTGLSEKLDWGLAGGPAAGEFVVFLAGAKKGKTTVLSRIGWENAMRGKSVLHVSLEVNKEMLRARYDSAGTGMDYGTLCMNHRLIERARAKIAAAGGRVVHWDWQYEDHSPSELIPIVKQWGPFDLLILDYLQLMVPNRTGSMRRLDQRHLMSQLGKDLRGVLKHLGLPCYTAWQVNREGDGRDTVMKHDINECWNIVQHADFVVGISRGEEEERNGLLRIHTLVQRFREAHVGVKFKFDMERNQLEEI